MYAVSVCADVVRPYTNLDVCFDSNNTKDKRQKTKKNAVYIIIKEFLEWRSNDFINKMNQIFEQIISYKTKAAEILSSNKAESNQK